MKVFNISNLLALVAIIISIITVFITRENNKKNLHKQFFEEIFFEYMLEKIPNILRELDCNKSKFKENCETFEMIVSEMLDASLFYKYFEPKFYNDLKFELIQLDEILTSVPDEELALEIYKKQIDKITKLSNNIYKTLKEYYS